MVKQRTSVAVLWSVAVLAWVAPGCPCQRALDSNPERFGPQGAGSDGEEDSAGGLAWSVVDGEVRVWGPSGEEVRRVALGVEGGSGIAADGPGRAWVLAGRELVEVDMERGAVGAKTSLPKSGGEGCNASEEVQLIASTDVRVVGETVCVILQDRNDNMMSVQEIWQVDRTSHAVEGGVSIDEREAPCEATVKAERCYAAAPALHPPREELSLDQQACAVILPDGKALPVETEPLEGTEWAEGCGLQLGLASASGRFQAVLWGETSGDYIYHRFVVIDVKAGRLIPETRAEIAAETPQAWAPRQDALLLENKLVLLGDTTRVVEVGDTATFVP